MSDVLVSYVRCLNWYSGGLCAESHRSGVYPLDFIWWSGKPMDFSKSQRDGIWWQRSRFLRKSGYRLHFKILRYNSLKLEFLLSWCPSAKSHMTFLAGLLGVLLWLAPFYPVAYERRSKSNVKMLIKLAVLVWQHLSLHQTFSQHFSTFQYSPLEDRCISANECVPSQKKIRQAWPFNHALH